MAKVICSLPNASEEIGGVKFVSHRDGMISEEVDDDVAARFTSIPGYKLAPADGGGNKPEAPAAVVEVAAPVWTDMPDPDPAADTPVRADDVPEVEAAAAPAEETPAPVVVEAAPDAPAEQSAAPAAAPKPAGGRNKNRGA